MEIYVHIPFCVQKCAYCDFPSFCADRETMETYISCLLAEAEQCSAFIQESIQTVYIGGGTPSILPDDLWEKLLSGLNHSFALNNVFEFTSECNPGTLRENWLKISRGYGVNRISMGIQASEEKQLQTLGRIHGFRDAVNSVEMIRKSGFQNLNADLIFGFPGQSVKDWKETLKKILFLAPDHISAYGLIPEEGTPLGDAILNRRVQLPPEEEERDMYSILQQELKRAGFYQYEISNFARPGYACLHNMGYWLQKQYIGIGLASSSMIYVSSPALSYRRVKNEEIFRQYIDSFRLNQRRFAEDETIRFPETCFETMMLHLRMNTGVSETVFQRLHHVSILNLYQNNLQKYEKDHLIRCSGGRWKLTEKGKDLQNALLVDLLSPDHD